MDRCPYYPLDPSGRDVHAEAANIRAAGPVAPVVLPGGVPAWSITGYHAARQALSDNRLSKDARQHWTAYREGLIGEDFPLIGWVLMDNLTTAYGEDHTRLRKPVASAFTPRRVAALRPKIEQAATALLDALGARPAEEPVDLKTEYARALPAQVICDLFGVPEESRAAILHGGEVNIDTTISPEESAANVERWQRDLADFVDYKRRVPGDDLTSDLISAQRAQPTSLSDSELLGTLHLMLATGTEPVMNLITNAVLELLRHPDQLAETLAGRATWAEVIEETLRMQAPVAHLPFRFPTEDVEIGGVTIPRGEPVLVGFAGAGRDPAVHGESAAEFDVARPNKEHLSFGAGIYHCIGMPLALEEAEIALSALFTRFPRLRLAVDPEELRPQVTFIMNGRLELPVLLGA